MSVNEFCNWTIPVDNCTYKYIFSIGKEDQTLTVIKDFLTTTDGTEQIENNIKHDEPGVEGDPEIIKDFIYTTTSTETSMTTPYVMSLLNRLKRVKERDKL